MQSTRLLSDESLLAQCRVDTYRGSGPGGQKRNKTSNAVRLVHAPSGCTVTATEARSLAENKKRALRRMRLKLASELREPVDLVSFAPPDWFVQIRRNRRIEASPRHPFYAATAGLLLDLLAELSGNAAAVGVNLGVTTSAVIRLLEGEPQLWCAANGIRAKHAQPSMLHRR